MSVGQKHRKWKKPIDVFFEIAIFICCVVMIFALVIFALNCYELSHTVNGLVYNYDKCVPAMAYTLDDNSTSETYMENLIDYMLKLQELESKSASSNIITFIYTFLSGALIGVASYFTKKSADSVKQIQENKELIMNLDNRTLFSNFYMYAQRAYSTIQIFDLSLDAIQDRNVLKEFVNNNITKINSVINEINAFTKKNEVKIQQLTQLDKASIVDEINKIGMIINNMRVFENNNSITDIYNDFTRAEWRRQIDEIKKILR